MADSFVSRFGCYTIIRDTTGRAPAPQAAGGRDSPPAGADSRPWARPGATGCCIPRGSPGWRLRLGDLRIVYWIGEAERIIVILRVARRGESTYRRIR